MRSIGSIFLIIICICCNKTHINYEKINSSELIHYKYDSVGHILDTLPVYIKQIKKYSIDSVDSSRVLLPNANYAIKYASYIFDTTYGRSKMKSERPFKIRFIDNKFWHITGTMPKYYSKGGSAEILISKYNGEILFLSHGK
jgi:hypothetical protein